MGVRCNFMRVSETDNAPHRAKGSGENGGRKTAVDNQNRFLTFHSLIL